MPTCVNCGGTFPNTTIIDGKTRVLNRRRYCLTCSPFGRHNTRRIHAGAGPAARSCQSCGVATMNAKFCSNQCQKDLEWRRIKSMIDQNGAVPAVPSGNGARAKRYLLETRGRRCEICGGTDWQGRPIPLVLDHVNGNASDWTLLNLRMVCGNCDMQLPTYKSRNRGKGRAWRRKRYAQGKSY
jgi:hypothetical protein